MTRIRVLLVDDHEVVRLGVRSVLESEAGIVVVGEVSDGAAAIRQAEALQPQVVVMDIRMGSVDGIEACRTIKERVPGAAVLILTSFGTDEAVMEALVAGASGFLVKNAGRTELIRAVQALAEGHSLLDPSVTRRVTERLVALSNKAGPPEIAELSPREREVLVRIAHGDTNRQIADRLVI